MDQQQHITELFKRFETAKPTTDEYLQKLYEQLGFDDLELAILFQSLSIRNLHAILKEQAGVTDEHLKQLEQDALEEYKEDSKEALLNQVVKYNRLASISLATLELVIKDMR